MIDSDEALNSVLATDRPSAQRIALLYSLQEELRGEKAVLTLLAVAQKEKALELRRAFFEHAAGTAITRVSDRAAFVDGMLYFAAIEDEPSLRRLALSRLGKLSAQTPLIEDVLLETLLNELDADAQQTALDGLSNCVGLRPENLQKLLSFIPQSPADLREDLVDLLVRFDVEAIQAGLILLLDPSETEEVREQVLEQLGGLPRLEPLTLEALQAFVLSEHDAGLQAKAIAILRDSKQIDAELFNAVFKLFTHFPDRVELIEALHHRLASFPELAPKLTEMFRDVRSAQLRVRILKLLESVDAVPLFAEALKDASWQVRRTAIECCAAHHSRNAAEIERAVMDAARAESVVTLREEMAKLFSDRNRRDAAIDREILDWMERETEPRVERALARALAAIPPSSDDGGALLRAYKKILTDPAFEELDPSSSKSAYGASHGANLFVGRASCRDVIIKQLRNFAFRDEPDVAQCLRALLMQTDSIEEVEELYARLRELEPDVRAHADLILALFFRFANDYPREPVNKWITDFQTLAPTHPEIRAQIPYIVRLTGATWITSAADTAERKSMFLPGLMEQIRRDNWIEAGRLLREAWESRTIRKSDMILFFKKLLRKPNEESLMQASLVMMAKGGMTTPDILNLGFAYLDEFPRNGSYTGMIADFLQGKNQDNTPMRSIDEKRVDLETGRLQDPNYRQRVFEAFNQRGLSRYWRLMAEEMEQPPAITDWTRWEYELWPDKGIEWVVAKMFLALKPFDRIAEVLASPVDPAEPRARSIHYLLLLHLWQNPNDGLSAKVFDELLRGMGILFRHTAEKRGLALLHDRATLVFRNYWTRQINSPTGGRRVAPELAEMAAEIYAELCAISARFETDEGERFPAVFPEVLQGLNSARLKECWRFNLVDWERLFEEHFARADEDAKARAIYENAQLAEQEARFEDAYVLYQELLETMSKTGFVKKLGGNVKFSRDDCDPNKKSNPADEGAAKGQYDFMQGQIQKGKTEQALRTLDRLMKRYWRTEYFKGKREELVVLRRELAAKLPVE